MSKRAKKAKKAKAPKAPKRGKHEPKVDVITGHWVEEGSFISGTGNDTGSPYEGEGSFGSLKSNILPNGRYIFDQSSYDPSNPAKQKWILFDDTNANKEFDTLDKAWGLAIGSEALVDAYKKGLGLPFSSNSENAGRWEASIGSSGSSGKVFKSDFHMFDIQFIDLSAFAGHHH